MSSSDGCGAAKISEFKPAMAMVLVQVVLGIINIFYKLALNDGMKSRILVPYRYLFATAFLCPIAYVLEREKRPKTSGKILLMACGCGFFGATLSQNMYVAGIKMTSATFATAMMNLMPAITFILAVILRMEKLGITTAAGQAKVGGTLIGICGAMVLTFYKGAELNLWSTNINLLEHHHQKAEAAHQNSNMVLGAILTIASCVSSSIWTIIQAKMTIVYPAPYSITALMCCMASVQALIFGLCTERDMNDWKMGFDVRLLTVAFSGVIGSALIFSLLAWCIQKKGALFATIFNPLMLVVVTVLGSLLINEKLHVGSIIGTVLIVIGLYAVLWGKGREAGKVRHMSPEPEPLEPAMEPIEIMIVDGIPISRQGSLVRQASLLSYPSCLARNPSTVRPREEGRDGY